MFDKIEQTRQKIKREEEIEKLNKQKEADLASSILFCLGKSEATPFLKFLLDTTMVLEPIAPGLPYEALLEVTTLQRVGKKLLNVLMESNPELTGKLLVTIEKDKQNEKSMVK